MLTVHGGELQLPTVTSESSWPVPTFAAGAERSGENADGVVWRIERDVPAGTTACVVDHGSSYATSYGHCTEHYDGRVSVDLATHDQTATATASYTLRFDDPPTGSNDRFFPVEFQRRIARERLAISIEEMPGGHLVALSQPSELADRLEAYAAERSPISRE